MNKHPAVVALAKAAEGLLYVSETEAELEPFLWETPDLNDKRLLELAGAKPGTPVEETTLDTFFRTVSKEDKPRFDKLAKAIGEQLTGVKVYKVGAEAERQVYVVGKTNDGQWAGLKTSVVET